MPGRSLNRTAALLFVAGLLCVSGLADAFIGRLGAPLRASSEQRLNRTLTTATVAYVSAAALDSTVSVLKTSEMEASFFVVGGSVTVGEILDPIHDLIEQLSSILTVCIVSLGLQRLLLSITTDISLRYILGPALLLLAASALVRRPSRAVFRRLGRALIVVAVLGRFGLPLVVIVSDEFSERTLSTRIEDAQNQLQKAQTELSNLVFGSTATVRARIETAKDIAERAVTAVVDLMVAFLFRVVLLPILILYLVMQTPALLLRNAETVVGRPD